jgi:hypothetical protein
MVRASGYWNATRAEIKEVDQVDWESILHMLKQRFGDTLNASPGGVALAFALTILENVARLNLITSQREECSPSLLL